MFELLMTVYLIMPGNPDPTPLAHFKHQHQFQTETGCYLSGPVKINEFVDNGVFDNMPMDAVVHYDCKRIG